MIQTYNPGHYAIQLGAKQDYDNFFIQEMKQRKITKYPPYFNLILLEFQGANEEKLMGAAYDFKKEMNNLRLENLEIVGPIVPYYSLNQGKYKRVLLLKFKKRETIEGALETLLSRYNGISGVDLRVNVDPLDY